MAFQAIKQYVKANIVSKQVRDELTLLIDEANHLVVEEIKGKNINRETKMDKAARLVKEFMEIAELDMDAGTKIAQEVMNMNLTLDQKRSLGTKEMVLIMQWAD